MKKLLGIVVLGLLLSGISYYFYNLHKNTYLECTTVKEKKFFMKIDRPYFALIFDNSYFLKDDWYTRFNEIYTTEFDIVIRDKDKALGNQFFYESMSLSRQNLELQAYGFGKIGSCIQIKKAKNKI